MEELNSLPHENLGTGTYGTCYKVVEPNTLRPLVVKTFIGNNALKDLVTEAINLHELRLLGVRRLVGVCVETR